PFSAQDVRYTRIVHSFPTRRSSDLDSADIRQSVSDRPSNPVSGNSVSSFGYGTSAIVMGVWPRVRLPPPAGFGLYPATAKYQTRSEEHTSELQSRVDLVCRLLLEKK